MTVTGTAGGTAHSATYTLTVNGTGGGGGTVTVTNPGYQFGYINLFGANVQVAASDSKGLPLTFSAAGLPPGVTITRGGYISGVPTSGGGYQHRDGRRDRQRRRQGQAPRSPTRSTGSDQRRSEPVIKGVPGAALPRGLPRPPAPTSS